MQDQWEKLAQVSSGQMQPSFDPQQEAADALQLLLDADVVLTSYDVLRQEVHYSPQSAKSHSLRHAKRYSVPESPLLSVRYSFTASAQCSPGHLSADCLYKSWLLCRNSNDDNNNNNIVINNYNSNNNNNRTACQPGLGACGGVGCCAVPCVDAGTMG